MCHEVSNSFPLRICHKVSKSCHRYVDNNLSCGVSKCPEMFLPSITTIYLIISIAIVQTCTAGQGESRSLGIDIQRGFIENRCALPETYFINRSLTRFKSLNALEANVILSVLSSLGIICF